VGAGADNAHKAVHCVWKPRYLWDALAGQKYIRQHLRCEPLRPSAGLVWDPFLSQCILRLASDSAVLCCRFPARFAARRRKHFCVRPLPFMVFDGAFSGAFSGVFGRRHRVYATSQLAIKVAYIWGRRLRWGEQPPALYILQKTLLPPMPFYLSAPPRFPVGLHVIWNRKNVLSRDSDQKWVASGSWLCTFIADYQAHQPFATSPAIGCGRFGRSLFWSR